MTKTSSFLAFLRNKTNRSALARITSMNRSFASIPSNDNVLWSIPTGIPISPVLGYNKEISICFLGTSSAAPTSTRSTSSLGKIVAFTLGLKIDLDTLWIFDVGDGTVRQIASSPVSNLRPSVIFITHLHEDHVLGLPSLLKYANGKVTLVGPIGLYDLLAPFINAYDLKNNVSFVEITPPEKISSSNNGTAKLIPNLNHKFVTPSGIENSVYVVYQDPYFAVIAVPIRHSTFTLGYVVYEKSHSPTLVPRKITILGDTCFPWNVLPFARYSDVLVHECTFLACERYRAELTMHSTTAMAGSFARSVLPQKLYLNHFSKRYFLYEVESHTSIDPHTELVLAEVYAAMGMTSKPNNIDIPEIIPTKDLQIYRIPSRTLKQHLRWISINRDEARDNTKPTSAYPIYPFDRLMPSKETPPSDLLLIAI